MFPFHAAFALGLISLTAGTALYAWSASSPGGKGMSFAKLIGLLVIIFSIISTLCTVYYGVRFWWQGYLQGPLPMMRMQMQNQHMMDGNMRMPMTDQQTQERQ